MGRKVKSLSNYSTEEIEELLSSNSSYFIGIKLHAILQHSRGYISRFLSEFYGVSFNQSRPYYLERNEDACKVAKVDIKKL